MDSSFPPRESIHEQRRSLAEDSVSYAIYLLPYQSSETEITTQIQDPQQNNATAVTALESVQLAKTLISSIVAEVSKGYIWHKDAFSLSVASGQGKGSTGQPYLRGQTRFGDSIDDEWLVVHLLREITKRIPGSVARVQDNDGEFLLIEAADHIPSWLDPENSDNRVFIYQGNLHIIPIAITADEKKLFPSTLGKKSKSPKLLDALELIRSSPTDSTNIPSATATTSATAGYPQISTLASTRIQEAAFGPLSSNSQERASFATWKIREQRHFSRCQIPVQIARVLKARPELVSRAAEAFYTRDAVGMAVCSRMSKFLPVAHTSSSSSTTTTTTTDAVGGGGGGEVHLLGKNQTPFVTTAVCFTKTCYAQLIGQQFQPPKTWDGIVPPPKLGDAQDSQKVKEAELGMKLTCGFEILCSKQYLGDFGFRSKDDIQFDSFPFATDESWRIFKNNLASRSYFGDERVGSAQYQLLEEAARRQFLEFKVGRLKGEVASEVDEDRDSLAMGSASFHGHEYHPVQEVERILASTTEYDVAAKDLIDDRKSDDDSWMDVDLQDLEDMMRARGFGGGIGGGSSTSMDMDMDAGEGSKSELDMQQMLDRFGTFVEEGEGGVEGAEFLDEMSDDDEDDTEEDTEDSDADEENTINVREEGDASDNDAEEEDDEDSDEDMFASDYEDKQAAKRAATALKRGGSTKSSGGAFMFGADMMAFENGVSLLSSSEVNKEAQQAQAFAMDHGKFKDILTQTFGAPSPQSSRTATKESAGNVEMSEEDDYDEDDMDYEKLKEYMSALDVELSTTKVGESFEKTTASARSTSSSNKTGTSTVNEDKGKGVPRKKAAAATARKPEKNLEELMKEATDRSRRGFNRHGPLGMPGPSFGYDPAGMSFADDEDDDDEDVESGRKPRVSTISADGEVGDELDELDEEEEEGGEVDQEMVDLDLNLAKNLLESFKSQGGLPGPGGNLLARLGIILPRDDDDDNSDEDI
ncbi:hypothetical protein BGZ95_009162 [Linnemannia exigua]|uniref:SGT1-domain-containing protein n=1 Tax=Linnemannia exigua TaxID=604196 RepID=A0AAD4HAJ1_9FUNG|nr:hypothetical protein BGZ95_009162 [Linnemannia exigua]